MRRVSLLASALLLIVSPLAQASTMTIVNKNAGIAASHTRDLR